jgi:hypothetical protein
MTHDASPKDGTAMKKDSIIMSRPVSERLMAPTETPAPAGPVRIQLRRTKGWEMPPNTVKVDRTTKWGNPFVVGETYPIVEEGYSEPIGQSKIASIEDAVYAFRPWCDEYMAQWGDLEPLRGKNLACWCAPGSPCHADVLLELANAPAATDTSDAQLGPGRTQT